MHEQAILMNNHPLLGVLGSLVSISKVEGYFSTSILANNGITYSCANPHCQVKVTAVVPLKSKPGRKSSPASHFRGRHISGCTREPQLSAPTVLTNDGNRASKPNRQSAPSVWKDPQRVAAALSTNSVNCSTLNGTSQTGTGGQNANGNGTNQRQSQMVENFAREWEKMSVYDRQQEDLRAPWNPKGNYYSAFFPLKYYPHTLVHELAKTIFVGTIKNIIQGSSGYVITLTEQHVNGQDLRVWVKNETFDEIPCGAVLRTLLAALSARLPQKPTAIFALGNFSLQQAKTGNRTWYSLIITHPHMMWVDA